MLATLVLLAGAASAQQGALERCRGIAEPMARLACYDAITPAAPAAGPTATTAPAAPLPAPAGGSFGLPAPAALEQTMVSSVGANFHGWEPNSRIRLDNGQVWQVVDSSSGTIGAANRKVTVRRGALGSFFLEFEGLNKSPRVRRVQ